MDTLKNKKYESYDYVCRYTNVPYFYDTKADKEIYGIGTNLNTNTAWVAHKVKPEDNLDSLALEYYNNPTLWWAIAYFNKMQDPFVKLSDYFSIIKIPAINGIAWGNER